MLTTDLSLRFDSEYEKISRRFLEHPDQFANAFARAWFKLTHRDMGPRARYLGPEIPKEEFSWQDSRSPAVDHPRGRERRRRPEEGDPRDRRAARLSSFPLAWGSASTFRGSDKRGGANGARIRLAPQRDWPVNKPLLGDVIRALESGRSDSTTHRAAEKRGVAGRPHRPRGICRCREGRPGCWAQRTVPFAPGRTDASQEQTDVESVGHLEPIADGFRNYGQSTSRVRAEELLIDRPSSSPCPPPELTVLLGGLRAPNATTMDLPRRLHQPPGSAD